MRARAGPRRIRGGGKIRQYELVERVRSYDPQADEALLNRAYVFSMKAHGSQTRASGDPYFSHPVEVAGILTDMKLDSATIAAALLHDVVEDTDVEIEEIEELFGRKVAELVDGVTKLSRIELKTERARAAENFRKFVLAMSNDIRVLLIKLADRLHNMRTLHFIRNPDKRRRIARETLEIYAPLAERIGIREWKDELEDLAFRELEPEAYETVTKRLRQLRRKAGTLVTDVIDELKRTLAEKGMEAEVTGREKRPYSIWKKMEAEHIPFEQISDVMAFRIVVDGEDDCYRALGVVHRRWPMIPQRFKDYISTPKRNGYQSIHTTVIGPRQTRVEIQIRTRHMHDVAEYGVAAHWRYKQGADDDDRIESDRYRWLRVLLEILENAANPEEFLEHTKLEMFHDQVFCFTPKGDLIALPKGSTPVDFAYAVHTEVGNHCVGAKVNGRIVPLGHVLENGDQVEILTSKNATPKPRWERFVVTGKARSAVRRFIRQQEQAEYARLGRTILERAFEAEGVRFTKRAISQALDRLKEERVEDVFVAVGRGELGSSEVLKACFPGIRLREEERGPVQVRTDWEPAQDGRRRRGGKGGSIPIEGLTPGLAVHLADCCHPVPGDRIVGILTAGRGVTVHTIDCEALSAFEEDADHWLDLSWNADEAVSEFYAGRLKLIVLNERGALASIAAIVAKHEGNISNLRMTERDREFYTMLVDVEVHDLKHLTNILTALRALPVVSSAERVRG